MAYQRYIGREYTEGNVTPVSNVAVSLGQPQKRWKEVYVDANSLHLGNVSFSIGKTNQLELMRTNKLGQPVANVVLANSVAKPLKVMDGGTGATTLGDGYVLLGSGAGAISALNVTAKGSILAGDGSGDPVALAVGTNGQVLSAASGEASGLEWVAAGSPADRSITQAKLAENSVGGSKVRANVLTGGQIIGSVVGFQSNVTGNVSVTRSLAVGYVDGKVPTANLDVKGNVAIEGGDLTWKGGDLGINESSPGSYYGDTNLVITNTTTEKVAALTFRSATDGTGFIAFADSNSGNARFAGYIQYQHATDMMTFAVGTSAEVRLTAAAMYPSVAGTGSTLGLATHEWAGLFLDDGSDTSAIKFGEDQDISLTHVHDTGLTLNGSFAIADGAVATPSLTNIGDLNTGIWFPAADTMAASVGGREALRIAGSARGGHIDSNITINSNVVNHKGLAVANYTEYANNIVNAGSSFTVSTGTNMARYTLNASHCEITLPAGQPRQPGTAKTIVLYLKQDATGGRTVDFNAPGGEALEWNNSASEPEVVSGANKVSIYTFMKFHGDTNWYCSQSFIEN